MLYTGKQHNIVSQPYANKVKLKKKRSHKSNPTQPIILFPVSLKLLRELRIYIFTYVHEYIPDYRRYLGGVGFMGNTTPFRHKWLI